MPMNFPISPSVGQTYTFNGTTWIYTSAGVWDLVPDAAGGGATGGGTNKVFYENDVTVTTSYTITTNKNAMTAGPVTINSGATVTVPSGSTWTVV